jgi:hypothetical protein
MMSRARICMLPLALLAFPAACASTSDSPADGPDGGGAVVPGADGSTETDADAGGVDGARPDANLADRICSDDDFCHSAVATGTRFRGLWGDGTGVLWAVTLEQDILRWDGASWNVHHHTSSPITSIWGSGPTDVWVATEGGLLHGTGDSSAQISFAPTGYVPGDQTVPLRSIWGTGPLDVWAVGGSLPPLLASPVVGRGVRYSDDPDLGLGWQRERDLPSGIAFDGVWGSPQTGVWLHGGARSEPQQGRELRILRRAPGASTWASVALPADPDPSREPFLANQLSNAGTLADGSVVAIREAANVGSNVYLGKTSDGGVTFDWTIRNPDPGYWRPAYAAWGLAANDAWAVGRGGLVVHWDGSSWTQAAIRVDRLAVTQSLWAIWGTSNDDFWIVGDEIAMHRTRGGKP